MGILVLTKMGFGKSKKLSAYSVSKQKLKKSAIGKIEMTVKELIESLKTYDGDCRIAVELYEEQVGWRDGTAGHLRYSVDLKTVYISGELT